MTRLCFNIIPTLDWSRYTRHSTFSGQAYSLYIRFTLHLFLTALLKDTWRLARTMEIRVFSYHDKIGCLFVSMRFAVSVLPPKEASSAPPPITIRSARAYNHYRLKKRLSRRVEFPPPPARSLVVNAVRTFTAYVFTAYPKDGKPACSHFKELSFWITAFPSAFHTANIRTFFETNKFFFRNFCWSIKILWFCRWIINIQII